MDNPILLYFVSLTVFTLMLALGVNHSFEQLTSLWRRPGLLLRSLVAVVFLIPIVVLLLLWVFDLPPAVATRLAVSVACAGRTPSRINGPKWLGEIPRTPGPACN